MNKKMSFEEALNSIEEMIRRFSVLRKGEMLEGLNQEDLYAELSFSVQARSVSVKRFCGITGRKAVGTERCAFHWITLLVKKKLKMRLFHNI